MTATTQYWGSVGSSQKMRFTLPGGATYILTRNPQKYGLVSFSKAKGETPISPAPNLLNGGSEFASISVPLEWGQMDEQEYLNLQPYHLQPCTMIDMDDIGYFGWLVLGGFDYALGVQAKVGSVKAQFIISTPANGLSSVVSTLAAPLTGNLTATATTGGSLAASTSLYYVLTLFSIWGQTTMSPVVSVTTAASAGGAVDLAWTAPSSAYFRKARLWVSTSSNFVAGSSSLVKADVYSAWNQTWTDYCGISGVNSSDIIPATNGAYTGQFVGGRFVSAS